MSSCDPCSSVIGVLRQQEETLGLARSEFSVLLLSRDEEAQEPEE